MTSLADVHASSLESRVKVDLSVRCISASLTYWSYVTAHGPSPLSVSGNRRFGFDWRSWMVMRWYGRRLGVALRRTNRSCVFEKKFWSLSSTQGGMSLSGGDQSDLTYSFGVTLVSSRGWLAKKTFRLTSRSSFRFVVLMSPVVEWGVRINFMPKPRTAFASGGTILPVVRSWKASFDLLKYVDAGVCSMLVTAFWNGVWVVFRRSLY